MPANFKLSHPIHFLALGFGSGLLKPAPGTWGTVAGIPLLILFAQLFGFASLSYLLVCVIGFLIGIYICGKTARDVGVHDHSSIVWDEVIGLFIAMLWLPLSVKTLLLAFILFRFFDILKPWPISYLDKHVHGGFGIMIDDVLAGLMACAVIHLLLFVGV